ncbi:MAG: hypothetical protein IKB47_01525 [Clostridia bacterium]|nr:hypothetical protein [Clostridia bacterium]
MKKFAAILAAIMILAMLCGTIVPVAATEETPDEDVVEEIDSSMYDAAAEGDLLYTLNFNGDEIWQPDNIVRTAVVNVDPDNPHKVTVYTTNDSTRNHWGGSIKGLPLAGADPDGNEDYYAYTITYKVTRKTPNEYDGGIIDSGFGFFINDSSGSDGIGVWGWSYEMAIMSCAVPTLGYVNYISDGISLSGINYSEQGVDRTQPSVQEYAIEANLYTDTVKFYAIDSFGAWVKIQETEVGDIPYIAGDYLTPSFYLYFENEPVDVEDVKIYKGMTISGEELPVDPSTGVQDTTTVAQDTTTVPADTTTVPADTTTAPAGNDNTTTAPQGNTTTKAPESNGCGGFAVLPVSIVAILGLAVTVVAKKTI